MNKPHSVVFTSLLAALWVLVLHVQPAFAQGQPSSTGSVLNIILLGLIAYFLVRMFRRRRGGRDDEPRPGQWSRKDSSDEDDDRPSRTMDRHEAARQMWDHLSSEKQDQPAPEAGPTVASASGFDEHEFLEGAKLFFSRYQQASDSRDFEALKVFLSDEVYTDAVLEAERNPEPGRTEIMLLNARLMEVKTEGDTTSATVFYDAQIRKGAAGDQPEHVRVVWEFSRDDTVENGLWTLETINKVDQ